MGSWSPVVNVPAIEFLEQEELEAIEEAFALIEDPSRNRKTMPVTRLGSDHRRLPDWRSTSAVKKTRRIAPDCVIESPEEESASSEYSRRKTTLSIGVNSNPRNGIWNLNPPSCRCNVKSFYVFIYEHFGDFVEFFPLNEVVVDASKPRSNQTDLQKLPFAAPPKMQYPSIRFSGRVIYSRTTSEAESAVWELLDIVNGKRKERSKISIGLDIEWRPTFRRGGYFVQHLDLMFVEGVTPRKASVMQLCVDAAHCFVLHIIHSGIPHLLHSLLEDEGTPKVGVGIAGDASKILNDYGVHVKGLEDLSGLANHKLDGAPKQWSLSSLTETLICKQLEKPKKIRLGNWEAAILSNEQLQYAATDAYASWYLHQVLDAIPELSKISGADE